MKNQVVTPNPTVVYSSMWTKLKAHVGDYAPQTLVTDMEVASGSSMRDVFGEAVHVQYCYFHLRKCLREHIGEVHALAELSEPAFYNLYRMVISLPFIPAGDLVQVRVSQGPMEGVLEPAIESAEGSISAAAMGFLNYFVDTYVAKVVRKKLDALKRVMVKYYEFEGHEGVSEYLKLISAILS